MAYAWFLAPYKRNTAVTHRVERYCAIEDFAAQVYADGGDLDFTEILGDQALVKVRASDATVTAIGKAAGIVQIPNHYVLSDSLADLSNQQKNFLNNKLLGLGFSQTEIDMASQGDWGQRKLDDLFTFLCVRRLQPRYDAPSDKIILDGPVQKCRSHRDVAFSVK